MIPSNPKAELLVLGCCLLGGVKTTRQAAALVTSEDFATKTHLDAWQVITSLMEAGEAVDTVSLALRWPKVVEQPAQLPEELLTAPDMVPSPEELPTYVAELKQATKRRLAWTVGTRLATEAGKARSDPDEAMSNAVASLQSGTPAAADAIGGDGAVSMLVEDLERRHELQGELSGIATGFPDAGPSHRWIAGAGVV